MFRFQIKRLDTCLWIEPKLMNFYFGPYWKYFLFFSQNVPQKVPDYKKKMGIFLEQGTFLTNIQLYQKYTMRTMSIFITIYQHVSLNV